ncbi:hypothetical protein [Photorhabdus khanii]|uniref:phage tail fiber protein n=1 Tax=Photorhabdus khanii TaxID=1004150 RepID=UPI001F0101B0|nr:hypothetical protein [Photorhabdus khanii]
MSSYNTGAISIAANSDIATGTNTKWKDNKFGVAPAQTILIKVGNAFKLSAIKNVNNDTELVLIDKFPDAVSNATYFIQTSVPDTYSDAARKVTAQLGYTDELLFNLNKWMTENGVVTVTTPEGKTIQLKSINALASDISNRLTKDQNGADIPNKSEFIKNLGLAETVNQAKNAVPGSRKVNGKALTGDISLSAGDVGAYTKSEGSEFIQAKHINYGNIVDFATWIKGLPKGGHSFKFSNNDPIDGGYNYSCGYVTRQDDTWAGFIASYKGGKITFISGFDGGNPGMNKMTLWNDWNAKPDANGNLRVSSPVVDIHPDGTYELTSEAEGVTVKRIETGKYRISGCNGFAKDGAWGIHGGTIVPADSNGLNLIWVYESVDTSSGEITIECYHRQNTDAPIFAQNKRVKSVNGDGDVIYYNDGELCDIPDGRVINVRVQMPVADDPASPSA